ncbi:TPA: hypothetical protein ACTYZB_004811 [Klebsiella variicola]
MTQLSREVISNTLKKWTNNYSPKQTDKTIEFYIGSIFTATKKKCLHIYIKKETCEDLEYNLVIYPFKIIPIGKLIEEIPGVGLGKVELNSNFTIFDRIIKDENGKRHAKTGYSIRVETIEGLICLLEKIRDKVESRELPEVSQPKLVRQEDLQVLYIKATTQQQ